MRRKYSRKELIVSAVAVVLLLGYQMVFSSLWWGLPLVLMAAYIAYEWLARGLVVWDPDYVEKSLAISMKPIEVDGGLPDAAERFARGVGLDGSPILKLMGPIVEASRPRLDAPKLLDRIELRCEACGYEVPPTYQRLLWLKGTGADFAVFAEGGRHPAVDGSCPRCGNRTALFSFTPSLSR